MNHRTALAVLLPLAATQFAFGAERVIASSAGPDVDIPAAGTAQSVTFAGTTEPATGFAIDAMWVPVVADNGGGTAPWSLDLTVQITPPGESMVQWGPSIFGDVTIAAFPMQDGDQVLPGTTSSGTYDLLLLSGVGTPWVAGLRDVTYFLTTTVDDVSLTYTATPDPAQMWSRPFFIGGVSGLGPVAYDAFEFTVDTSGVYEFESVLMPTDNHYAFLYEGDFNPMFPLVNLLDYDLGNGFSPFDTPRGTSRFSTLLLEGQTYTWVTSQWASFSTISPATNTVVGPGNLIFEGPVGCAGDCDQSGAVDFADLVAMLFRFGGTDSSCDADASGTIDFSDLVATLFAFGPCPLP